ncbi:phosphatase PAP2 family protein [Flavobacterium cellulosilyticum]|uniref:Phosphatase PAP2 family protein n=1 Tax=Flavobacterium cellulosilyticum TaxID=2541731 RepID=A0A4V2YZ69_9FLAO|nr:phosphatase PAP2 family protein [Flavobacterium cellulosilyticum]TDD95957.1 phosphatase PAP2 family protein [Flavobacterium cellulosilyticum]
MIKTLQNKNIGLIKNVFLFSFIVTYLNVQAQQNDTITNSIIKNVNCQQFTINDNLSYQYSKPKFFDFITKEPHDFGLMGSMLIQRSNLIWFGVSVTATVALLPADQKITNSSRNYGQQIGFPESHNYSGAIKMYPKNINSAIYRIGNGFTALLVGGGLLTYGLINNNYRAIHTTSELLEGLITSGLLVQPFKRLTGRESPDVAAISGVNGGNWQFAPSFAAYQKHTPTYDAMPSGHITTLMTTVMILSENYKEVKWIKPVGFGLMGLMGFEMLQSKVHWASDFPIAIFMGYIIGKSIVKSRITEIKKTEVSDVKAFQPKFHYSFSSNQSYTLAGVNMVY